MSLARSLKLPAYGKRLLDHRRLGCHPLMVELFYGEKWDLPQQHARAEEGLMLQGMRPYSPQWLREAGLPMLAVRPSQFERGVLDWRVLAGVQVRVCGDGEPGFGFFSMLGELAAVAGCVSIAAEDARDDLDVQEVAFNQRMKNSDGVLVWPDWFPKELNHAYLKRRDQWIAAARGEILGLRRAA